MADFFYDMNNSLPSLFFLYFLIIFMNTLKNLTDPIALQILLSYQQQ